MAIEKIFDLHGHRALVTGASSGLGVEFAETLAMAGADVVLVARREDRLRDVAKRIADDYGVGAAALSGDLGRLKGIGDLFRRCEGALGSIDILVNNAGKMDSVRAEKSTDERWQSLIDLNLSSVFLLCREFAKSRFAANEPGTIVNIASVYSAVGGPAPGFAAYAATKAAVANLTRQLAVEWGPRGIRVNALAPGFFPTELNATDFERPGVRERIEQTIPLGRLGSSEELRPAFLSLVAPGANYTHGSVVFVDGGLTIW